MTTRRAVMMTTTLLLLALGGCPKAPVDGGALDVPVDPGGGGGGLTIVNPTGETWNLAIDGASRGSVGPRSEARIPNIRVGRHRIVATNEPLGLEQAGEVDVIARTTVTHTLRALVTRLTIDNPHDVAVDIVLDGVVLGRAAPGAQTVFDAVPAGKRVLVARAPDGPAAVRVEQRLAPGGSSVWVVPTLAPAPAEWTLPTPPAGMGLVHMKNASRNAVTVFADGVDKGIVAPGGTVDIVLPPGTHKLEVRIEGLAARTEHTVTLIANQAAEWVWGGENP
ncbi:MAG: hypothetical protein IT385_27620 [Deltaproteobacteria bacterium]|nr:hypothetical protein [Deltaproteobacteria bacterium]